MMLASKNGYFEILKYFFDNDKYIKIEKTDNDIILYFISKNGNTALIYASQGGYCKIVKFLVGRGSHINAVDKNRPKIY